MLLQFLILAVCTLLAGGAGFKFGFQRGYQVGFQGGYLVALCRLLSPPGEFPWTSNEDEIIRERDRRIADGTSPPTDFSVLDELKLVKAGTHHVECKVAICPNR